MVCSVLSFWSALGDAKEGGGVVGVPEGELWQTSCSWCMWAHASLCYVDHFEGEKPSNFDGIERSSVELKFYLLQTMIWLLLAALSGHSFSTLEEFLDLCNFGWRFIASQVHNLCTWGSFLFIFNKALLIKKKKRRKNTSTNPIVRTRWIRADNNCKQGRKWSHPVNAHIPVSQEKLPAVPYVQPMCHPFPRIGSIHQMC